MFDISSRRAPSRLVPVGIGRVEYIRHFVVAGEYPADAVLGKAGVNAFGDIAADAVVAALDLVEVFAMPQADATSECVDRKPRLVDDFFEAFPVFEIAFADDFERHGIRVWVTPRPLSPKTTNASYCYLSTMGALVNPETNKHI